MPRGTQLITGDASLDPGNLAPHSKMCTHDSFGPAWEAKRGHAQMETGMLTGCFRTKSGSPLPAFLSPTPTLGTGLELYSTTRSGGFRRNQCPSPLEVCQVFSLPSYAHQSLTTHTCSPSRGLPLWMQQKSGPSQRLGQPLQTLFGQQASHNSTSAGHRCLAGQPHLRG